MADKKVRVKSETLSRLKEFKVQLASGGEIPSLNDVISKLMDAYPCNTS